MTYQIDYKIYHKDKNIHSRLFNVSNEEDSKIKFKEYCDGMGLNCEIINIIKL